MPEIRVQDEQGNIHVFPDGSTPEMIAKAMGAKPPSAQATSSIGANPPWYSAAGLKSGLYRAADALTQALPAAGATVGGFLGASAGPVGAIGGAAVGGMGGEALRQIERRGLGFESPQTSAEAAQGIAKEGAIQGALQGASELGAPASSYLKAAAAKQYEKALAPTTNANKVIAKNITPEMIDRGIVGSPAAIKEKAVENANAIRPQLNQAYDQLSAQPLAGSGAQVISDLEKLKGKYMANGMVVNKAAVDAINGVQGVVQQFGADVSPKTLRQVKAVFDQPVAARGGYAGADLTTAYTLQAEKGAANSIRDILHSASPDIAALDKEITFWLNVKRVAGATANRQVGQAGGLAKALSPLAGAAAGGIGMASGAGAAHSIEAAAAATGLALTTQIVRSPAWRTTSAVVKDRLATALASGNVQQVAVLAARLGIAGAEASGQARAQDILQPAGQPTQ